MDKKFKLILLFIGITILLIFANLSLTNNQLSKTANSVTDNLQNISIILAFFGGVLTLFAPCLIPFLLAYPIILNEGKNPKENIAKFFLGFSVIFLILGFSATFIGQFFITNSKTLTLISGIVILFFGILILFRKGFGSPLKIKRKTGQGNFFFGMGFAIGWAPCVGPILFSVLFMTANSTSYIYSALLILSYVLGIFVTFSLISGLLEKKRKKYVFWFSKEIKIKIFKKKLVFRRMNLISGILLISLGILYILFSGSDLLNKDFLKLWTLNYFFQGILLSLNKKLVWISSLILFILFIIFKGGYERSKSKR